MKNHESISQYKSKTHVKSYIWRKSNSFKHYLRKKQKEKLNIQLEKMRKKTKYCSLIMN